MRQTRTVNRRPSPGSFRPEHTREGLRVAATGARPPRGERARSARRSSGPSTVQRLAMVLLVMGAALAALLVGQLAWQLPALAGAPSQLLHLGTAILRVVVAAWITVLAFSAVVDCRPPWRLTLGAHAAGVLLTKASLFVMGLGAAPAIVLAAGLLLPAVLITRKAG